LCMVRVLRGGVEVLGKLGRPAFGTFWLKWLG